MHTVEQRSRYFPRVYFGKNTAVLKVTALNINFTAQPKVVVITLYPTRKSYVR